MWAALSAAKERNAMTFALPGLEGSYAVGAHTTDPFMHQELIEILYHTLWETVHVFFEHRELGHDVGEAGFLYPFLGQQKQGKFGCFRRSSEFDSAKSGGRCEVARTRRARAIGANRSRMQGHRRMCSTPWQADHFRKWRISH